MSNLFLLHEMHRAFPPSNARHHHHSTAIDPCFLVRVMELCKVPLMEINLHLTLRQPSIANNRIWKIINAAV
jgi:hypothetical protein